MNLLAFDTCFDACSVAAGRKLRSLTPAISFACEPMATGQAERLMPMIDMVMAEVGMAFTELDRIAVASGPGTFTGARIAVAAARALSLATGAPVVSLSSLELMAMNPAVVSHGADVIAIATDARRGEVYFQTFEARSLKSLSSPAAMSVSDAAAMLANRSAVIAGSGAAAVAEASISHGGNATAILPNLVPDAIDMLFQSAGLTVTSNVVPLYLRPPDAKPPAASPFAGKSCMTSNVTPFRNIKHVSLLWAAPERAQEIAALHQRLFAPGWNRDSVSAMLEHPASTSLAAVYGDPKAPQGTPKDVVGFIIGQLAADEAEIISLGVAPDWQRSGLGKMLVEGLIRAVRRGEAKRLFLEVADDNTAAISLYRGLGFSETGRRKKYYERSGGAAVDALVLA